MSTMDAFLMMRLMIHVVTITTAIVIAAINIALPIVRSNRESLF